MEIEKIIVLLVSCLTDADLWIDERHDTDAVVASRFIGFLKGKRKFPGAFSKG